MLQQQQQANEQNKLPPLGATSAFTPSAAAAARIMPPHTMNNFLQLLQSGGNQVCCRLSASPLSVARAKTKRRRAKRLRVAGGLAEIRSHAASF